MTAPGVTVIGIGNPYRRDDGAAGAVLGALAPRWGGDSRVRLVELDGESARVMQAWEGSALVWIVDAVRSVGAGPVQVFFNAVWPAVLPQFVASHLYLWEFNIRDSTILGIIGAGGLGLLISEAGYRPCCW